MYLLVGDERGGNSLKNTGANNCRQCRKHQAWSFDIRNLNLLGVVYRGPSFISFLACLPAHCDRKTMSPFILRVIWLRGWLSKRRSRHRKGGQNHHNKDREGKGEQISSTEVKTGLSFCLRSTAREGRNDRPLPRSCYCWDRAMGKDRSFLIKCPGPVLCVLGWNRKVQRTSVLRGCGKRKGKERPNALQTVTYFSALLSPYVCCMSAYGVLTAQLLPSRMEAVLSGSS